MDKFDRIYCLHQVFESHHYPVPLNEICHRLECSSPTAKRLIREMRDYLNAPIVNQRGVGYYYDRSASFQMPGLWFNAGEMQSLLAFQSMMQHIGPGFLNDNLHPLIGRIEQMLEKASPGTVFDWNRFRILGMAYRDNDLPLFPVIASAMLARKRMEISYYGRASDEVIRREVSPQRLAHYRDNWFLDAWCHHRDALRTFSLDRIQEATTLPASAKNISTAKLDAELADAYGIFSGRARHTAVLKFTESSARWVAEEQWHPEQIGQFLDDGSYELKIPYNNPTELIMDICRHGPDIEVIGPDKLREGVSIRLREASRQYE